MSDDVMEDPLNMLVYNILMTVPLYRVQTVEQVEAEIIRVCEENGMRGAAMANPHNIAETEVWQEYMKCRTALGQLVSSGKLTEQMTEDGNIAYNTTSKTDAAIAEYEAKSDEAEQDCDAGLRAKKYYPLMLRLVLGIHLTNEELAERASTPS